MTKRTQNKTWFEENKANKTVQHENQKLGKQKKNQQQLTQVKLIEKKMEDDKLENQFRSHLTLSSCSWPLALIDIVIATTNHIAQIREKAKFVLVVLFSFFLAFCSTSQ